MDEEPATEKTKPMFKPYEFIPKFKDKKITVRLTTGGQPITGTLVEYNPYELLIQTARGELLVFKHSIATIEAVDEPKGYKL